MGRGGHALKFLVVAILVTGSSLAAASPNFESQRAFSASELRRLASEKSVKRSFLLERAGVKYRAGLVYRLVKATPLEVMRALRRRRGLLMTIPYAVDITTLSESEGVTTLRIEQGKPPITGVYTLRMEWDLSDYQARFWVDPAYPHDLQDLWGSFRAREVRPGWTVVSFAFAFKIGGIASLLEAKAQRWGLRTADRLARVLKQN